VHLLPADQSRGAQTYARALRKALDGRKQRHRTLTLFASAGGTLQPDASLGVPPGRWRRLGADPRAVRLLRERLAADEPAVVVAHGGEPLKYAVLAGVPSERLVYYKIGNDHSRLAGLRRRLHRRFLRRAGLVAAVSEAAAAEARALGVPEDRLRVVPNGRDPEVYGAGPGPTSDGPVHLLWVGYFERGKRPEWFVEVVRRLREEGGPPVLATMAGSGPRLAKVREAARAVNVELLGTVADVPGLLAHGDVFLFTSEPREGMPGVLIEAGLAGLPVVTTEVPGASDVVDDGLTGFVVPAHDFDAFLDRTRALVADAGLRARLGAAGRQRCASSFGIDASVARWRALLADVTAARCTSST
jgi:glycosyltransferase involved in cell wall biosynthesis